MEHEFGSPNLWDAFDFVILAFDQVRESNAILRQHGYDGLGHKANVVMDSLLGLSLAIDSMIVDEGLAIDSMEVD